MTGFGRERGLKMFAEWTTAIKNGAVPESPPPRPSGIERNIVITMWNWGDNVAFVHDEIATDKRNPRVNPNGLVYGVDIGNDNLLIADPVNHWSEMLKLPTRDDRSTMPVVLRGRSVPAVPQLRRASRSGTGSGQSAQPDDGRRPAASG